MTDERFLDINDKINSIEYCCKQGIKVEVIKEELLSNKDMLIKSLECYDKLLQNEKVKEVDQLSKGVKKKMTSIMSTLYKIESILDNRID